jgi:CBS domain-containing protein
MTRRKTVGKKKVSGKKKSATAGRQRTLLARDLMTRTPITVREEMPIGELCDLLQANNINGAPVVDEQGYLLGVVTQEDIIYGAMGSPAGKQAPGEPPGRGPKPRGKRVMEMLRGRSLDPVPPPEPSPGDLPFWADARRPQDALEVNVSAIMTSPAISADESTPIADLCRIMWNLRIHRVPILKHGKVTGLVSSMDLCRAILTGKITV